MRLWRTENHARSRSGQVLVEFAVVAFVFTLLLGGMLALGFLFFSANVLQQAADVGAMELARLPLPPTATFPDLGGTGRSSTDPTAAVAGGAFNVFADVDFQAEIFDEQFLVVDLDNDLASGETLDAYFADKPLINRLLQSVMIFEEANIDGAPTRVVRYPGALVRNTNSGELTVLIPRVTARDQTPGPLMASQTGRETAIAWHAVIEEIRDNTGVGPFSLAGPALAGIDRGMAALRINYPYQSGALVAYQYELSDGSFSGSTGDALGEDVLNHPVTAIDGNFDPPGPYELVVAANDAPDGFRTHSGRYGLGHLEAFGKQVRPYRKLITAQGIYRREVFE